jgi:hypothetical protein
MVTECRNRKGRVAVGDLGYFVPSELYHELYPLAADEEAERVVRAALRRDGNLGGISLGQCPRLYARLHVAGTPLITATGFNAALNDRTMVVMPGLPEDASPELRRAWNMRMRANVSGLCEGCGAALQQRTAFEHADACPASDESMIALYARDTAKPAT